MANTVDILFRAQTDAAQAKLNQFSNGLQSRFSGLASKLAGALSVAAVVRFAASAVREFEAAEQAAAKLNGALRASGQYSDRYSGELQKLAGAFQRVTRHGDEAVLNVETQLVAFGAARAEVPRLTEAVLDLAEGMGMDLNSAALLVGKALQGEFSTLSRYGILVHENASRTEKLSEALRQIDSRFGGLARAAGETASSGLVKLKNQIGDLKEVVGSFVLTGLQPMVNLLHQLSTPLNLGGWQKRMGAVADLDAQQRKMREQFEAEAFESFKRGKIGQKTLDAILAKTSMGFTRSGGMVNTAAQDWALQFALSKLAPDVARTEPAEPTPTAPLVTEEQKQARQELLQLQAELNLATITGLDHERLAAAQAAQEREAQIRRLLELSGLSDAERARLQDELNGLLSDALNTQVEMIDLKEIEQDLAEAKRQDQEESARQLKMQQVIEQGLLELEREREQVARRARARSEIEFAELEGRIRLAETDPDLGRVERKRQLILLLAQERRLIQKQLDLNRKRVNDPALNEDARIEAARRHVELEQQRADTLRKIKDLEADIFAGRLQRGMQSLSDQFGNLGTNIADTLTNTVQAAVNGLSNALTSLIMGTQSAGAAFAQFGMQILTSFISSIIAAILWAKLAIPILTWLGIVSGGATVGPGLAVTTAAAGMAAGISAGAMAGRASGGPMAAGQPYIVGEFGPEIVRPRVPSMVSPNAGRGGQVGAVPDVRVIIVDDTPGTIRREMERGAMDGAIVRVVRRNALPMGIPS